MALTGVLRPGHAQIRVLDIEESVKWYTDVMGLKYQGRDDQGRAYFKTRAERDHNSIILRQADRAGLDFFGYKVLDKATLVELERKLNDHGVKTERMPAGDLLETGERVRFQIPTGHTIELYAEKNAVGSAVGCVNPDMDVIDQPGITPIRMDHALLYGTDLDGATELFCKVLGFTLVERVKLEDGQTDLGVWLTCSAKAHDIAIVRHGEPNKLHHVSFQLGSWEQVLRAADIMSKRRVSIDMGPTRHGITNGTTIYFFDPSGNRLETFAGGYDHYPDMEPITWTWDEVGAGIFYHDRKLNEAFLSVVT
ncbi:catechol 2,3-dioxygenase [Melaminivora suipulveris]|uniref:Metapyrocatechase n=1 Tax=Melaminivora suipulveris TaxID=2109913 RepID=A0A2R3QBN3_9BURK|nr:catechol 2,3-dioxygenase [Melaminivora suipulveris]AVO49186.1 catechol 2,3-dioxygenase [Melaminivora suipulveris]